MDDAERNREIKRHREMLINANKAMMDVLYSTDWSAPNVVSCHPYEKRHLLERTRFGISGQIACSDYSEVVNRFNAWVRHSHSFLAWNEVLEPLEREDSWSIYLELVEPVAFFCLHQPTSFRDVMTRYATHVIHAGNVAAGYTQDWLPEDEKKKKRLLKGVPKPNDVFRSRPEKEAQLKEISVKWPAALNLIQQLERLDDNNHRCISQDWRNESAHYIPPHLEAGIVRSWRRSIDFGGELVKQPDGKFLLEKKPGQFTVSYGFGGTDPISYKNAYDLNIQQLQIAREVMRACDALIDEICRVIGSREQGAIDLSQP